MRYTTFGRRTGLRVSEYTTDVASPPVVVLGHDLGATREMRLDAFAERFAQVGFAALAFTYRHFGDSGGHAITVAPRHPELRTRGGRATLRELFGRPPLELDRPVC